MPLDLNKIFNEFMMKVCRDITNEAMAYYGVSNPGELFVDRCQNADEFVRQFGNQFDTSKPLWHYKFKYINNTEDVESILIKDYGIRRSHVVRSIPGATEAFGDVLILGKR